MELYTAHNTIPRNNKISREVSIGRVSVWMDRSPSILNRVCPQARSINKALAYAGAKRLNAIIVNGDFRVCHGLE